MLYEGKVVASSLKADGWNAFLDTEDSWDSDPAGLPETLHFEFTSPKTLRRITIMTDKDRRDYVRA